MNSIVGLHDRAAVRIAQREIPDLEEAKKIRAQYTLEQVLAIARRCFYDNEDITHDELLVLLADARVRFPDGVI